MKIKHKYILLGLLFTLPLIAALFSEFGLGFIAAGFVTLFGITILVSLFYYLEGGFSK